ncbi:solute:Na+ symporter, SSS family [Terrimicrobium sacchariphilum]|uniref:Solute:Na+ symporter, SSS family n=1 Tax=Terrimicrobium sacchariphilum TaxID=690879 RepID=A0A146G720_TERSA|nr:sodium:proline symporter [Terrimicrobium sacchariphilum]GAT32568.1 solute:Na+ symporter, SSS family [Terrimicrobium sacchariphilum]
MHFIDWLLISLPLAALLFVAVYTRRYMRGVTDFLSGGRMAGRYLLAVARGEQGLGAVVFVATFEVISKSGFVLAWWGWLSIPVTLIVSISGWVIYRFRETRALTLAQFFEIRYSKNFRIFTGFLGFAAGMANFGIIPVVGSRFMTYFLGLPPTFHFHQWEIPTYIPLMALLLGISLFLALSGGLITLMISNCLEGMISMVLFLVIICFLLTMFSWSEISQVLENRPPGESMLNPFDSFGVKDFNIWFVLMGLFSAVYRTMAWQNQGAYTGAAITAHESRMGGIVGGWKGMGNGAVITLLAVCALTFLSHPDFATQAQAVRAQVAEIGQPQLQSQMTIPITVVHMLPIGIKGLLCIVLLMGIFGGDGTHLLSWGSLFIQDVVLPIRKKAFTPRQHILLLRCSMIGVATFAFIFGCLFRQTEYVMMWWAVTEAIYVGGAGVAIIGGLYWKKGTTAGAWSGLLTGSTLVTGGILARQIWGADFPLNGAQISFFGSIAACLVYGIVSWLTCREDFNMDKMLHRGIYAVESEQQFKTHSEKRVTWGKLIGLDNNFTRGDKVLACGLFGWSMLWFGVFIIGTAWNLIAPWPVAVWSSFWYVVSIGIPIFFAFVTAIWFSWGGIRDMRLFFKRLKEESIDVADNGMVVDHHNLADRGIDQKTPAER